MLAHPSPATSHQRTNPTGNPPVNPWRRRLRRGLTGFLIGLAISYLAVWWVSLRIVEHPSWPPPPAAVTAQQAQTAAELFLARERPRRDDVAIDLAATTSSPPSLFLDGDEFFPAMLDDIASATHSIHLLMFGMLPGDVADAFAEALAARAIDGLEVRLIVDNFGSRVDGKSDGMFTELREAGVEIVSNNVFPLDRDGPVGERAIDWRQDELGQVDHRKMLVVDGNTGWIGGAGLEDHFRNGRFTDAFARVEGDIVRQMQLTFLTSFHAYGGTAPPDLDALFPEQMTNGTVPVYLAQNIPGGFVAGTQASQETIEQATRRLDLMNPYFTDPGIIDAIVAAAERGVAVRLVVSQDPTFTQAHAAFRHEFGRLLAAGVEIWEHPGVMHAKVTVADDRFIIGTINFDAWALYRNLEIAMLFEDAAVANQAMTELIEPSIARSRSATTDEHWQDQLTNWFWRRFVYFM